ncbi:MULTISPECIES: MBL fold metallo-hydrolase [Thermoactinomyces]|jgi:phosphoribosyl 1,2-cyclic phosphodiesterase|uniref:MBL fold metallo-hydrolase n=1 Tax=Thermoactinomyces daqus TaxID=1329516 RepID=A0A7W1X896_9BACL|nr:MULTISPECIES: MBL fold metallo-hydrolase [Thermoactinomyces]MBA4541907.1 MBL fold metallo-hydrolase [Thermoactinomyces daqus]MBH8597906.1 MBL fold metallo-hydrolase [Thermoactinomyces sp. CICC 10523]MBH8604259.1 MBL fold metallo-hydrolase [Thermoactinomyces sp. CICC 10522]MBH8607714.1 MBL fold metallo-hydrolase [Thermoactinomyces sp. CICC 10521]
MKFSVLASGSTGNALFIESDKTRILIDAGLSGKQLEERMKKIDIDPSTIEAIFVTHEHIDHVRGLGVMARRHQIPVYMNEATWLSLPSTVGEIPEPLQNVLETGAALQFQDLTIESIPISHDAAEPVGYQIRQGRECLATVTDLGYVSKRIVDQVNGADTLIWESNHDVEMLRMGSYPWNVKRRILSDTGHLSNEDAGAALTEILKGIGENVYLAHLSRDNNMSELAHLTVKNILEETGMKVGRDVHLWPTFDDRPTPLREVRIKVKG